MQLTNREQWFQARKSGIGGSDAAAVLGKNPYMTNVDLWKIKTGRMQQEDISDKPYVKFGIAAEDPIRALFELDYPEYEVIYEPYNNCTNPNFDFIKGSFDGILIEKDTGRKGILEIKTTNILQSMQKEKWNDRIPDNYFCQILHYFLVKPECEFAILKARLRTVWQGEVRATVRHYFINKSDFKDDLKELFEAEIKFWDCVLKDIPPNLKLPDI